MKYRAGYKYQLAETWSHHGDIMPVDLALTEWLILRDDGWLTIRAGYAWDGASGPVIQTRETIRASLIHDAYYQLIRLGLVHYGYRDAADRIYRMVCIDAGMSQSRAEIHYTGLRIFGARAAMVESEPVVLDAP